jgi:hypothetical protein
MTDDIKDFEAKVLAIVQAENQKSEQWLTAVLTVVEQHRSNNERQALARNREAIQRSIAQALRSHEQAIKRVPPTKKTDNPRIQAAYEEINRVTVETLQKVLAQTIQKLAFPDFQPFAK